MAVAYSAIVNGGASSRPHLGSEIQDGDGRPSSNPIKPPSASQALPARRRSAIMQGLHVAATEPGGTSADVFKGFPYPVYGKTGTAERAAEPRPVLVCVLRRTRRKPIVVVVTVERGGFGAETAAPAACLILSKWFDLGSGPVPRRLQPDPMSAPDRSARPPSRRPRSCRGRWRLRLDPLLLLAALGLVACSLIALKGATADDIPGDPLLLRDAPGGSSAASGSS